MGKAVSYLLIFLFLSVLVSGCGGGAPALSPSPTQTKSSEIPPPPPSETSTGIGTEGAKRYSLGESFEYSKATFTFKKAEFREKIPVFLGETSYTPQNGKYLVVYFSFRGSKENESAGVNTDIFLLKDSQGRSHQMSSYTSNHEANDMAFEEGMEVAGMLLWNQEEEEDSLLVYDIPSDSSGLTMNIIYQEGEELKTFAIIDLGL
ncbi:MAG: DUF4352 domain-containing protein [Caldiserica bacterium]|jgi:hypothetical protein|nr:DUF4352 domain-containing protein [Caldisericota bacterium]MDH7562387.1 hypothetical protein [Caldisericota bacterium]